MTAVDTDRLRRLLGDPELAWLVERLRRRLARGRPLTGTVTKQDATDGERLAVARLLGRPLRPGGSVSVPLADLQHLVRRAAGEGDLRQAIEALTGPVTDAARAEAATEAAWSSALDEARTWAAPRGLGGWVDGLRASGLLRRLAGGDPRTGVALLEQARRVLLRLPAAGVPRPRLAATALGDSHALDDDRPLSTLLLQAAALLGDAGDRPPSELTGAAARREVWAGVGVLVGELSAPALTLGLRAVTSSASGRLVAAAGEAGEPLPLTLRQLLRDPPRWTAPTVWMCENPTVLAAAADELGERCPPLVCGSGQPTAAVTTLLRQLRAAGAALRYHGDFDWPGLGIANGLVERYGAVPWRMDAGSYLAAAPGSSRPLAGRPIEASWDAALAVEMTRAGVRVEEELVLDELLSDLDAGS